MNVADFGFKRFLREFQMGPSDGRNEKVDGVVEIDTPGDWMIKTQIHAIPLGISSEKIGTILQAWVAAKEEMYGMVMLGPVRGNGVRRIGDMDTLYVPHPIRCI